MCCDEIRQVARSSINATSLMSGTLEQPDALVDPAHDVAEDALRVVVDLALAPPPPSSDQRRRAGSCNSSSRLARPPDAAPAASSACRAATSTRW